MRLTRTNCVEGTGVSGTGADWNTCDGVTPWTGGGGGEGDYDNTIYYDMVHAPLQNATMYRAAGGPDLVAFIVDAKANRGGMFRCLGIQQPETTPTGYEYDQVQSDDAGPAYGRPYLSIPYTVGAPPLVLAPVLLRRHRAEVFQGGSRRAHITP
jgi:hypothetical protein